MHAKLSRSNGYVVGSSRIEFLLFIEAFTSRMNLFLFIGSPHFHSFEKYLMYHERGVLTYCVEVDLSQPLKGLISLMFIILLQVKRLFEMYLMNFKSALHILLKIKYSKYFIY